MALSATTIAEVETGGSDTANGGLFDPGQTAGMFTDGAATVANTSAPVFTSASYNFVAGDANAWIYIASGSNWIPGWYQITLVAANAATLNGTIGQGVLATFFTPTTVVGCATTAGPSAATWTIDYSQQSGVKTSYTDLASAGTGLTVSSAAHPFGRQQVGNCIVITGVGTNFNLGRYVIASVAAITFVATVVGPGNITTGAGLNGLGAVGGAFASPGAAAAVRVAGNPAFLKSATYSITSASTNIAGGCISDAVGGLGLTWTGYGSVRGDGVAATLQASGISTFTLLTLTAATTAGFIISNLVLDGASLASSQGVANARRGMLYRCTVKNCTNIGISSSSNNLVCVQCLVANITGGTAAISGNCIISGCEVHGNTVTGISVITGPCIGNLVYANTGGTSDGVSGGGEIEIGGNSIYGNGRDGIRITSEGVLCQNNICEGNTGYAINASGTTTAILINNAIYNNGNALNTALLVGYIQGLVTGVSSFFINAASANFALNNTPGAGAAARAAGFTGTFPAGLTTGYPDIGAVQHQDTPNIFPVFD